MYYIIGLCFRYRVIPLSSPLCLNALNSTPTMIITLYMSSSLRPIQDDSENGQRESYSGV